MARRIGAYDHGLRRGRRLEVGERQALAGECPFQPTGQAAGHPDVPAQAGRVGDDRALGRPGELARVESQTSRLRNGSLDAEFHACLLVSGQSIRRAPSNRLCFLSSEAGVLARCEHERLAPARQDVVSPQFVSARVDVARDGFAEAGDRELDPVERGEHLSLGDVLR